MTGSKREVLVIVEGESQAGALTPHIKSAIKDDSKVTVLALDYEAQSVLREAQVPFRDLGAYLRHNTVDRIDTVAWRLANTWGDIDDVRERLSFRGIFLGELLAYDLTLLLTETFTKISAITRAIGTEHPHEVIVGDERSPGFETANLLANSLGFQLRVVQVPINRLQGRGSTGMPLVMRLGSANISLNVPGRVFDAVNRVGSAVAKMTLALGPRGQRTHAGAGTGTKVVMLEFNVLEYADLIASIREQGREVLLINTRRPLVWSWEAMRKLRKLDVRSCTFQEYLTPESKIVQRAEVRKAFAMWSHFLSLEEVSTAFRFEDVSTLDFVHGAVDRLFLNNISRGILYLLGMEQLLLKEDVGALVVWNDSLLSERSSVLIAREMGIPSLVIQHGITSRHPLWGPIYVDKYAVWGKAGRDALAPFMEDSSDLVMTGDPRTPGTPDPAESRRKVYARLGIRPDKKLVVYASQPLYCATRFHALSSLETLNEREGLIRGLLDVAKKLPEIRLLVKQHPLEGTSQIHAQIPELKNVPIVSDLDIRELLAACDVLITVSSTVGLEAMLFEKPVITVNLTARDNLNPYAGSGAVIEVTSAGDIADAVIDVLEDHDTREGLKRGRERFLRNQLHDPKQAIAKVSDLINRICLPVPRADVSASAPP